MIRQFAASNRVDAAIHYFYSARTSPPANGLMDVSVANKILHLCVTNKRLEEAKGILEQLRRDSHSEINGVDTMSSACIRPDVVTYNIVIKGLARERPPRLQEIKGLIEQMERPFHLGGDGLKADQTTFSTAINAAAGAGLSTEALEFFEIMRSRKIRVDAFTCSSLVKALEFVGGEEVSEELCRMVEEVSRFMTFLTYKQARIHTYILLIPHIHTCARKHTL